jgi:hypothetical protein
MTHAPCNGELRATLAHPVRRWRKKCDLPSAARYASASEQITLRLSAIHALARAPKECIFPLLRMA